MIRRRLAATLLLVVTSAVLAPAAPAAAGTFADYPEFPYAQTGYNEPYRGQFHFSPRSGWMNDPNGMIYYRGLYHLFFQHNPESLVWNTMHWGHATSTDMVHWTQRPIALEPGVHPGDLFSGNAIVDTGNVTGLKSGSDDPIIMYSGTNGVIIHYSTDGAKTFQTFDRGRKVVVPPGESRDPYVFWHAASNRWVMIVWAAGGGNGVHFYTSANLLDWTYRSRFGADWFFECPNMFPLPVDGNPGAMKWVLTSGSSDYVLGSFDGTTFRPDSPTPQRMDQGIANPGGTFYAAQVFTGVPDGRIVQMAWQPGNRGSIWTGNQTFPAELTLKSFPEGTRIVRTPIREISSLRSGGITLADRTIAAGSPLSVTNADTYEITAEFDLAATTANSFGLRLHTRADGSADRVVGYDRAAQTLYGKTLAPVNNRVKMRMLVDRGQLEIFGNDGRLSISDNVNFNSNADSQGVQVYAVGGTARLVNLQFYRLGSAWGVGEPTLDSNLTGQWQALGGTWADVTAGKQGRASGDAFYLNSGTGADFTYEGDVSLVDGVAAALTFRATADGAGHYTANIDAGGQVVKLWRPGRDIAAVPTTITRGRTYHLKIVTTGQRIRVYLDHHPNPLIDATDSAYASGRFGVNVFAGTATFDNVNVNAAGLATNVTGPWRSVGGIWTAPGTGLHARAPGDAFYLSGTSAANFTYQADLRVVNGVAAALTFRATADAGGHYTANIDAVGGYVKLWRPGHVIATYPTRILENRTYQLRVVAQGAAIAVYLNGARVIDAVDSTYASGFLGLNAYSGTATFHNLILS